MSPPCESGLFEHETKTRPSAAASPTSKFSPNLYGTYRTITNSKSDDLRRQPVDVLSAMSSKPLDFESHTPLYQQLEQRILQMVATGVIDGNTALPTETSICEAFGLSRATVRRCFKDLVEEGHVVRRRGQGTFLAHGKPVDSITYSLNFSAEMESRGMTPSSKILHFRRVTPSEGVSKRLKLRSKEQVWEISRLRLADGKPMRIESVYVPCSVCPDLTEKDLEHSLYGNIAEASGLLPASAREVYEAVLLDKTEAKYLQQPAGSPAFRRIRTTFDASGAPFEASVIVESGFAVEFVVDLDSHGATFRRRIL